MKKFIKAAREARSIVKKQYARELTYELMWIEGNPEWKNIPWEKFYKRRRSGEIMIENSLANELKSIGISVQK